jgi:hypothetical protein
VVGCDWLLRVLILAERLRSRNDDMYHAVARNTCALARIPLMPFIPLVPVMRGMCGVRLTGTTTRATTGKAIEETLGGKARERRSSDSEKMDLQTRPTKRTNKADQQSGPTKRTNKADQQSAACSQPTRTGRGSPPYRVIGL